jgi:hypothetical protein
MENDYSINDYQELEAALSRAEMISHGAPDRYQYFQNELSKHIAYFLLLPYRKQKLKRTDIDE